MSAENWDGVSDVMDKQETCIGRPAAGEDPVKREQILDGAERIFSRMGFDAASMNDITREAGVSKGTIYVYFENKGDLFASMIERHKSRIFAKMRDVVEEGSSVEDTLHKFGTLFVAHLTSEKAIHGMRMVVGVIERMPELAKRFYATGPNKGPLILTTYLDQQVKAGIFEIDDTDFAARQFGDLCLAGIYRARLFGEMQSPPTAERIEKSVSSALRMFVMYYGTKRV